MVRRQYLILKQKHEILKRKQKVVQHNKIVDVIGRHNPVENNVVFKRRNALVDEQLQEIESLGS
jgi:hemerythrin-like domain-containing protein